MAEVTGWLLDVYGHPRDGLALWLLVDQGATGEAQCEGDRRRLTQDFPVTFYVAGPAMQLRSLWKFLQEQDVPIRLSRQERRDLFQPNPIPVLAVQTLNPVDQPRLFACVSRKYPDLTYYDADIALPLRHAAAHGSFPLARLRVEYDERNKIRHIQTLDSPWDVDTQPPPLRVMSLEPDCDPRHAEPQRLDVRFQRYHCSLELRARRPLLINLASLLKRYDPDLLLTAWGDTWLLPRLLEWSDELNLPLPLNREVNCEALRKTERSYFTYGQIVYRGEQVQLYGRWHIDMYNAMMFHDYGLEGVFESARVSAMPMQDAARLSPGSGISAMQIVTALRQGVLVPWHKQQAEMPKTALDFLHADQGGLVYQPSIGLHRDVAEIDFISMYPSIMARFNISPETVGQDIPQAEKTPELNLWICQQTPGLIPLTLKPLLEKRILLKSKIAELPHWDPRRKIYKARSAAHKWLLVTCFGYLGYKNARFGRIEAHQAVTAYSRECLLRAKEAIEDAGGNVLHLYVDGLWAQKPGCTSVRDFQPILDEIARRTHLPVGLEGIYRWIVFLPSRVDERASVANRYFGVYQDGTIKARGIEARRQDTPLHIAETQMRILEILAQAPEVEQLPNYLPQVMDYVRRQIDNLRNRRVPLEALLVRQKLSRELEEYRCPSYAAIAAAQLAKVGKTTRPGQTVSFLYTLGHPGVYAWDLPNPPEVKSVNIRRYIELLMRAVQTVLQPLVPNELTLPTLKIVTGRRGGLERQYAPGQPPG